MPRETLGDLRIELAAMTRRASLAEAEVVRLKAILSMFKGVLAQAETDGRWAATDSEATQ